MKKRIAVKTHFSTIIVAALLAAVVTARAHAGDAEASFKKRLTEIETVVHDNGKARLVKQLYDDLQRRRDSLRALQDERDALAAEVYPDSKKIVQQIRNDVKEYKRNNDEPERNVYVEQVQGPPLENLTDQQVIDAVTAAYDCANSADDNNLIHFPFVWRDHTILRIFGQPQIGAAECALRQQPAKLKLLDAKIARARADLSAAQEAYDKALSSFGNN